MRGEKFTRTRNEFTGREEAGIAEPNARLRPDGLVATARHALQDCNVCM